MGLSLGGFTMVFHSTAFILDMHKFPFVGMLSKPFTKFCLNNSVIPMAYLMTYIYTICYYQRVAQKSTWMAVFVNIVGVLAGFIAISLAMSLYIAITNKDIFSYRAKSSLGKLKQAFLYRVTLVQKLFWANKNPIHVHSYLDTLFRIGYTKNLTQYHNPAFILKIFNQNQLHLIFFEVMAVILLLALGFFSHHAFSQIPAAASSILFLAILMMFMGMLSFWTRGWATTITIIGLVLINLVTHYRNTVSARASQAFGIQYAANKAYYTAEQLSHINAAEHQLQDKQVTLEILTNWRKKFPAAKAPKLVIVCASGGGQKAALWALNVLQTADRLTQGELMKHTVLMSCVSGGALGASYFRELCLRHIRGEAILPYDPAHLDKIARNTLNPMVFSLLTNDLLLDVNQFRYQGMTYRRDRGHALEEQVNRHTDYLLDKPLKDYQEPEYQSTIPMMLLAPHIINDGRKLFVSPHQVSYMSTNLVDEVDTEQHGKIKGVDFMRLFKDQGAENLRFLSALRMAATYPYVLPSMILPSTPTIEVVDAGVFDNFGVTDAVQFLYVFKDWILKHTSGVVLVTIKGTIQAQEAHQETVSLFKKLNNPIGDLQHAWINMQDIRNDDLIKLTKSRLHNQIEEIEFQYTMPVTHTDSRHLPSKISSLSWYLTTGEKQQIIQAIHTDRNQTALRRLCHLLR